MSAEQKSLKDVCDLLLQLIAGGGVSPTDILNAINYISRDQTYDLKTVINEISNNNLSLFYGDSGGPSLLFDQIGGLTAAQLLTLQNSLIKKEYKKAVTADVSPLPPTQTLFGLGTPVPLLISGSLTIKVMNKTNRDLIFGQGTTSGSQLVYAPTNTVTDITAVCNVTNAIDLFEVYIRSATTNSNGILYFTMEGAI